MKIKKIFFEFYKWAPYALMVNCFCHTYNNYLKGLGYSVHLTIFLLIIIPFVHYHALICRHLYTQHQKEGYYEL